MKQKVIFIIAVIYLMAAQDAKAGKYVTFVIRDQDGGASIKVDEDLVADSYCGKSKYSKDGDKICYIDNGEGYDINLDLCWKKERRCVEMNLLIGNAKIKSKMALSEIDFLSSVKRHAKCPPTKSITDKEFKFKNIKYGWEALCKAEYDHLNDETDGLLRISGASPSTSKEYYFDAREFSSEFRKQELVVGKEPKDRISVKDWIVIDKVKEIISEMKEEPSERAKN